MLDILLLILCVLFLIILSAVILRVYQKNTNASANEVMKPLIDRTVIVTGGTRGMGLLMAMAFAGRGARVIIACPDEEEGRNAQAEIGCETYRKVEFIKLDLSSLDSVRKFADIILRKEKRLDILMNNAGVLTPPDFKTQDGMNFTMQVNYYGHFLLTLLLLPLMKKTGTVMEKARIVNVSSVLHRFGTRNIDSLNKIGYWYRWQIYCNSKLCMAMYTRELSRRLQGTDVVVNSVDPGAVGTTIYESCGSIGPIITYLFKSLFKTPWEGAQTALFVAFDNEAGYTSGEFYKNCKLSRATKAVYDKQLCLKLWDQSCELVNFHHEKYVPISMFK